MNITDNYIELDILVQTKANADLGLHTETDYRTCMINLDFITHFYDYGNGLTVFCDETGQSVYIANIEYSEFKKLFNEYRNAILTFDKKN